MQHDPLYQYKEWFLRIARSDEQAFRAVYDHFVNELYLAALKMTKSTLHAEEIVQEVFIKLWVNRSKLPAVEKPDGYIFRILYNHLNSYLTSESNRERIVRDALRSKAPYSNVTEEMIDVHESQKYVDQAIGRLTPHQKNVYELSRKQGLSIEQIAIQLNISPNTVKVHLARAQETIRKYLKDIALVTTMLACFRELHPF